MNVYIVMRDEDGIGKGGTPIKGFKDYHEAEAFADKLNKYSNQIIFYVHDDPIEVELNGKTDI